MARSRDSGDQHDAQLVADAVVQVHHLDRRAMAAANRCS
jgi:hypothetical protein